MNVHRRCASISLTPCCGAPFEGQHWGLKGLWMMLWPLYTVLCILQFIGYTTKDWEVVSDRIIARLRARCEDTVDLVDVALSHWPACCSIIGSFAPLLSTMGVGAEILRWA